MFKNELFERRKFRRIKFGAKIRTREVLADDFINYKRVMRESEAVDISKGGMQIITEEAWADAGDRLIEVEFSLPGRDIRVVAHIVWFMKDDKTGKYRSGAEFIVIKSGDVEAIGNLA